VNRVMAKIYQHEYVPLSIYGHVVSLLRDQAIAPGVHLDIGCGYGAIAEPVREELGLTYLGFDLAEDGLDSLRRRGFEVHNIDLLQPEQAEAVIRKVVGERRIASLSFLDTLEHLTNGAAVVAMLRRLADPDAAPLVLSVPNVTHKDLALKLIIGRWDMTEAGLLDFTHVGFYNRRRLSRLMASVGWRETQARDWLLEHSDQEFPLSAPTLNPAPPLGHFLRRLIDQANPAAIVNQFVRLYEIDTPQALPLLDDRTEPSGRFLSVIVAVQEDQIQRLKPLLRSLSKQTHQDFEVVVVVHPCQEISSKALGSVIARLPVSFRRRVCPIAQLHEHRVHALNAVLPEVAGQYVVFLRNSDLVHANWCATFAELASHASGTVVRVGAVTDERSPANNGGDRPSQGKLVPALASSELFPLPLERPPSIANVAMPAGLFRDLGLRFDSELGSAADWDLVTQSVMLCGLSSSDIAAVSFNGELHVGLPEGDVVFDGADSRFLAKLNAHPLLLPIGTAERIQRVCTREAALLDENARVWASTASLREEAVRMFADITALREENAKLQTHATAMTQAYDEVSARFATAKGILTQPLIRAFVTSWTPALADKVGLQDEPSDGNRLFLSVITRTMGTRLRTLRDVLMCLAGQSIQSFELLIILHSGDLAARRDIEALVAEFPLEFRQRIRILTCERPGRAAPLNDAISEAKGEYIAVLDDDDFVFGHWVETFQELARESPGAMLRAVCARQDFEMNRSINPGRPRSLLWFQTVWPANYDAIAHLHANFTPFMSFAFPAAVFHNLGLRFDESLSTTEDWDFQQRVAMLCGVATTRKVTSIYRWWTNGESSIFLHSMEEWAANRQRILHKFDTRPVLLPSGTTSRVCQLIEKVGELERVQAQQVQHNNKLEQDQAQLVQRNNKLEQDQARLVERNQWMGRSLLYQGITVPWSNASDQLGEFSKQFLTELVNSRSWRWTKPLRRAFQFLRGRTGSGLTVDEIPSSFADCQQLIWQVRRSHSWRFTAPLRQIRRMVRGIS
jgi:glycosyltransferase involved in cell wall biosynthesis/2-polyprenyl-3-methyl-5-hydroxy-6-metoxy-1,4-benzoquinol methylase